MTYSKMMHEIWVTESIITVFIIIYFLRPFVKRLWPLDGLVWLPVLALLLTAVIFPAYGFRPECVPLLLLEIVFNIVNIPALVSSAASLPNEDFRDRKAFFSFLSLLVTGGAIVVMFAFSPKVPLDLTSEGVKTGTVRDNSGNTGYFVRVYAPTAPAFGGETSPVLFLAPPEAGSIPAVDRVCAALRGQGFTVVTYSRRGFDFPAVGENGRRYLVSPAQMRFWWQAFRKGTVLKNANDRGKLLEAERLRDLEFLLPRVRDIAAADGGVSAESPLFLAAYNAGGGAAALLAGDSGFARRFPYIRGIIIVESVFWSAYFSEPPIFPEVPADAPWRQRFRINAANWFAGLRARRVTGFKPLFLSDVPVLCIVSDRALSADEANPYKALGQTLSRTDSAEMAAVPGAGPLDFCDYPLTHPLYSFLFPGVERATENADPAGAVAGRIRDFAETLLAGEEY